MRIKLPIKFRIKLPRKKKEKKNRLEKFTSAVRETSVSWHNGGIIKGPT